MCVCRLPKGAKRCALDTFAGTSPLRQVMDTTRRTFLTLLMGQIEKEGTGLGPRTPSVHLLPPD